MNIPAYRLFSTKPLYIIASIMKKLRKKDALQQYFIWNHLKMIPLTQKF